MSDAHDSTRWFLRGGGECGATARATDWSATPLGEPEQWPSTLKTTVATLFQARQPMFLWWGPELVQLYNDAYLPSFGKGKHPRAMGQRGRECWGEIWPIIGPQIDDVMQRALASWHEDSLVPIFRNGRMEEVYWTYTYSPVFEEDGRVAATLVICTETTNRVLAERRSNLLHTLVTATSLADDLNSLFECAIQVLQDKPLDIPFAAVVEFDARSEQPTVRRQTGVEGSGVEWLQAVVAPRPVAGGVVSLPQPVSVTVPEFAGSPIEHAYVAPFQASDSASETFVVLGVSSRLSLDQAYARFLEQVIALLNAAKARVEETTRRTTVEVERRNLLLQAPMAAALLVGPEHRFELANPMCCRMLGRPDLVGKTFREAFPEANGEQPSSLLQLLDRVYRTGEPFAVEEFHFPLDRGRGQLEECFFKFNLEPLRERGQVYGMMAVALEVTEQVQSRQRLEKAHEERERLLIDVEKASRAKDEFLAMLGHELRNPLSPIVTALELMRLKAGGTTTKEQDVIRRQTNHLIRLVDDLLDVAKIARGKVELRREIVDLHDVVVKAAETVSDLLERRQHRLTIDVERGLVCNGDPVRLAQVVGNVLANSARYTDPGGLISVAGYQERDQLVLQVKDNGVGISPEMLPWVFKLFEQGKRSTERAEGGLGIGLALVKNLVSLHGGDVSAQSEGKGKGSEFTIRLPRAASGELRAQPDEGRKTPQSPLPRRVLVVDDNVDAVELLQLTLETVGHQAMKATDALAALELAETFAPDVAILDIGLPVMDGYELAARLRELPNCKNCRLIALTGYGQAHDRQRSRAAGFDEHLVKPVDVQRLLEALDAGPA